MEKCREAEVRFHGEELKIYGERMTILQKAYNELLVLSNKRVSDLHTLHDFITAAHSGINVDWVRIEFESSSNQVRIDLKIKFVSSSNRAWIKLNGCQT